MQSAPAAGVLKASTPHPASMHQRTAVADLHCGLTRCMLA